MVKRFGGIRAVDGATLSVREGSITALIGPNGAGKTTLFNVHHRLLPARRRLGRLRGQAVLGRPPYAIARLGMVRTFQITKALAADAGDRQHDARRAGPAGRAPAQRRLPPGSVRRREAEVREQAMELLEIFNLDRLAGDYAGTLSGGQRKLLELARALMTEPRFLLLDEPMAGINPTLGRRLLDHMKRLRAEAGGDVPVHRARHGGGHEPLRPGDRDGRGPRDRRGRATRGPQGPGRDRRLSGDRRGGRRAPARSA